ncbi:hypothetical protein E4T42_07268 [Aureobasidium subglaciale]|nr:hypothetical protein E4T42_07268 [Aureobasidium subglaciale]
MEIVLPTLMIRPGRAATPLVGLVDMPPWARLYHCHFLAPTPSRTPAYPNRSNDLRRQYLPSPFSSPNKSITSPRTSCHGAISLAVADFLERYPYVIDWISFVTKYGLAKINLLPSFTSVSINNGVRTFTGEDLAVESNLGSDYPVFLTGELPITHCTAV